MLSITLEQKTSSIHVLGLAALLFLSVYGYVMFSQWHELLTDLSSDKTPIFVSYANTLPESE